MKTRKTKISIVTPSYNQGHFIEETIRSVIAQQYSDYTLQYIIQDNCSNDDTPQVLVKYQGREIPQIHVEKDAGQVDALNRGFGCSDGEILGWVNSDDVLLKGALAAVAEVFESQPNVDIVYGKAYFINKRGMTLGQYPTTDFNANLLLNTCFLSQPSVFFRKSIYEKVGGFNRNLHYCLDYNLWLKFYLADATFFYLKKPLSATRVYSNTKTATGGMKFVDEVLQMFLEEIGEIPNCWKLYYEYSKEKDFSPSNKISKFIKVLIGFLLSNPHAVTDIAPWVAHIVRNKMTNHLTKSRLSFGTHYSVLQ